VLSQVAKNQSVDFIVLDVSGIGTGGSGGHTNDPPPWKFTSGSNTVFLTPRFSGKKYFLVHCTD